MFDFHEKRKIRGVLYSWPVIVVIFVLTIFLGTSAFNMYTVAHDMGAKLDAQEAELHEMEERAQVIEAKVQYLQNDRGIEEELRNRFDAIREGEQEVIIIDSIAKDTRQKQNGVPAENSSGEGIETETDEWYKFW